MEYLLRPNQYSQWKARSSYFLKPFTIDVFVNDSSLTSSLEIAVANSYFVNAGLVFLSLACNNCSHFCFKVLKTDTSSDWRRSIVCRGNFKIVTFLNIAELGNQHVRDDHHISLIFLQALHWMYRSMPFFPFDKPFMKNVQLHPHFLICIYPWIKLMIRYCWGVPCCLDLFSLKNYQQR